LLHRFKDIGREGGPSGPIQLAHHDQLLMISMQFVD